MHAAIVIPTRERAETLDRTLATLKCDQTAAQTQIIVSDNSSDGATREVVDRHGVTYVKSAPGISRARNAGVAAAGDAGVLLFLDDDMLVPPGWAGALIAPILSGEADATVCQVTAPSDLILAGASPEALAMLMTDESIDPSAPFLACSFAIRRGALEAAGGFDVDLGVGSGVIPGHEDLLLTLQLQKAGCCIRFVEDMKVQHLVDKDKITADALMRRYVAGAQSDGWMAYHWFGRTVKHARLKAVVASIGARLARLTPKTHGWDALEGRLAASAAWHRQVALEQRTPRRYAT